MSEPGDIERKTVEYHARQQCSRQWSCFLGVFFDELVATAGEQEARAFMRHLGTRMAAELRLDSYDSLELLENAINSYWRDMNWGWVQLSPGDRYIKVFHGAAPTPATPTYAAAAPGPALGRYAQAAAPKPSSLALGALLEGVYSVWLESQGGEPNVPLRLTAMYPGGFEFVYGH